MKKFAFCIFTLFIFSGVFAQQQPKPRVVVAPFNIQSGVTKEQGDQLTEEFYIHLYKTKTIDLVDRSLLNQIIEEQHFQPEDWSNTNKTAKLGKTSNAEWLVQGNIQKVPWSGIRIIVRLRDIYTLELKGFVNMEFTDVEDTYKRMDVLVDKLIQDTGLALPEESDIRTDTGGPYWRNAYRNHWEVMSGWIQFGSEYAAIGKMLFLGGIHYSPAPFISFGAEFKAGTIEYEYEKISSDKKIKKRSYYITIAPMLGWVIPFGKDFKFFADALLEVGDFGEEIKQEYAKGAPVIKDEYLGKRLEGKLADGVTPGFDVGFFLAWGKDAAVELKYRCTLFKNAYGHSLGIGFIIPF